MNVYLMSASQYQAQMDFGLFFISIIVGGPVLLLIYAKVMDICYKRFKIRIPSFAPNTMLLISLIIMTIIMTKVIYF